MKRLSATLLMSVLLITALPVISFASTDYPKTSSNAYIEIAKY